MITSSRIASLPPSRPWVGFLPVMRPSLRSETPNYSEAEIDAFRRQHERVNAELAARFKERGVKLNPRVQSRQAEASPERLKSPPA